MENIIFLILSVDFMKSLISVVNTTIPWSTSSSDISTLALAGHLFDLVLSIHTQKKKRKKKKERKEKENETKF